MIYFIHIPKTAGSTFSTIVEREYGSDKIINLNNQEVDIEFDYELFNNKINSELQIKHNPEAVVGHIRYGIHKKFQGKDFYYVTFFRNPVDQFLSQYYYSVNLNEYPEIKKMVAQRGNIIQYMESDLLKFSKNMQTYFISDAPNRNFFIKHQNEMLSQAIKNINQSFIFCGIMEFFDESLIVLKEMLNWRKQPYYIKKKVNRDRPTIKQHNIKTIHQIANENKYDAELYQVALLQFRKASASIKHIKLKLILFKIGNLIFQLKNRFN